MNDVDFLFILCKYKQCIGNYTDMSIYLFEDRGFEILFEIEPATVFSQSTVKGLWD